MHVLRAAVTLVFAASIAGRALAQDGNLIRNGDFEAGGPIAAWRSLPAGGGIASWRISSGHVDLVGGWWQPAGGAASVEVGTPGPGALEQSIATVPGQAYRLQFALSGNPEGPPRVKTLIVTAGPVVRTFRFDSAGHTRRSMGWRTEMLDFTATAGATTIGFTRADGSPRSAWWGPAIDDVSVTPLAGTTVPGPAATSSPASAAPVTTPALAASPVPALKPPAARPAIAAFRPAGGDPYSGLWAGAYPGKALRVYLERHGDQVAARVVDGSPTIPTGRLAWSGRVDRSPPVVLGACSDADAKGLHGAVIEWLRQDAFQLHIANCHAGDVLYTRWRGGQ